MNERKRNEKKTIPSYPYFISSLFFVGWLVVSPHTYSHSLYLPPIALMPKKKQKKQPPWRGMTHFDYQMHVIFLFLSLSLSLSLSLFLPSFFYFLHPSVCPFLHTARTHKAPSWWRRPLMLFANQGPTQPPPHHSSPCAAVCRIFYTARNTRLVVYTKNERGEVLLNAAVSLPPPPFCRGFSFPLLFRPVFSLSSFVFRSVKDSTP